MTKVIRCSNCSSLNISETAHSFVCRYCGMTYPKDEKKLAEPSKDETKKKRRPIETPQIKHRDPNLITR